MPRKKKVNVDKLPVSTEPQGLPGPTPYEYLFAETAKKDPNFIAEVEKELGDK